MDLLLCCITNIAHMYHWFAHCIPRTSHGHIDFLIWTGRLNRLQFIICFITLMILFHIVHYIDEILLEFCRILTGILVDQSHCLALISNPLPIILRFYFGRRIHDIGFNAWAGILWSVIMIFINTYSAVSPFNYMLELFYMAHRLPILGITRTT